jgi:hypothetical protein
MYEEGSGGHPGSFPHIEPRMIKESLLSDLVIWHCLPAAVITQHKCKHPTYTIEDAPDD